MLLFDLPLARLGLDDIDDVGELRRRISRVRKEERMARGRTEEWVEQPAVTKITSKRAMVTRRRCHVEQLGTGGYVSFVRVSSDYAAIFIQLIVVGMDADPYGGLFNDEQSKIVTIKELAD
nr:hypothetical protein Iba_chr01cCG0270 [Ipomoea batatas]